MEVLRALAASRLSFTSPYGNIAKIKNSAPLRLCASALKRSASALKIRLCVKKERLCVYLQRIPLQVATQPWVSV